jgi:CheY-like chemotaxis protein
VASAKVLIVEDNEMNRDMLSRRLQRRGFTTVVSVDGEEGLAAAFREKPDVIIMDMGLPILDGWEATRRLKSSEETKSIPIIALTADAMLGDRDKAFEAGVDDFDTKPVDFNRLLKKIDALLGLRSEA